MISAVGTLVEFGFSSLISDSFWTTFHNGRWAYDMMPMCLCPLTTSKSVDRFLWNLLQTSHH